MSDLKYLLTFFTNNFSFLPKSKINEYNLKRLKRSDLHFVWILDMVKDEISLYTV